MLKTLHTYLTRDLLKVMLLSLVAITLLLTVLAIIQPLRKFGLAGQQVLQLFVYTLPVMLSFTLPVATLFAATLVYGRFSQDNELLACRASGVSMLALLRPALVLGASVMVISLALSNFVAPNMMTLAELAQANVRELIYSRLKSHGYIDVGKGGRKHVIHADFVDPEADTLHGVVYAYIRKPRKPSKPGEKPRPGGAFLACASAAYLDFLTDANGNSRVVVQPINPSIIRTGSTVGPPISPGAQSFQVVLPLDNPVDEKPSWYSWNDLLKTLENPSRYGEVDRKLQEIRQMVCGDLLTQRIVDAVRAGKGYRKLVQGDETYRIEAAWAHRDDEGAAALSAVKPGGKSGRLVSVLAYRGGKLNEVVAAQSGKVTMSWSPVTGRPQVTIKLRGDVRVNFLGPAGRRQHRTTDWARGEIPVPGEIRRVASAIRLSDLYEDPTRFTSDKSIIRSIQYLKNVRIPRLQNAMIAELHARVAYGASCFLMVTMGAALGLIFRGGQFISAFAISAVPAALVIAMLLMGKTMARNPDVDASLGLACIWGSILALLAANVLIYLRLARK